MSITDAQVEEIAAKYCEFVGPCSCYSGTCYVLTAIRAALAAAQAEGKRRDEHRRKAEEPNPNTPPADPAVVLALEHGFAAGIEAAAQWLETTGVWPSLEASKAIRALRPASATSGIRGASGELLTDGVVEPWCPASATAATESEVKCANCGYPRREHTYNGACYGLCGEFVPPRPSVGEGGSAPAGAILEILQKEIRLVASDAVIERVCDDCGEPLVWRVKLGNLERCAELIAAALAPAGAQPSEEDVAKVLCCPEGCRFCFSCIALQHDGRKVIDRHRGKQIKAVMALLQQSR